MLFNYYYRWSYTQTETKTCKRNEIVLESMYKHNKKYNLFPDMLLLHYTRRFFNKRCNSHNYVYIVGPLRELNITFVVIFEQLQFDKIGLALFGVNIYMISIYWSYP